MEFKRVLGAAGVIGVLVLMPGCASEESVPAASQREERCVRLLRDLRLYCENRSVRGERAALGMDCLQKRLEFERACF